MKNKGRKSLAMIIVLLIVGSGAYADKKNRWNLRFQNVETPPTTNAVTNTVSSEEKSGSTNNNSSKIDNSDKKDPVTNQKVNIDTDLHCRTGVLKLNRYYNSTSEAAGLSTINVPDRNNGSTHSVSCMEASPGLISAANIAVNEGTITLSCKGGTWNITAASCKAPEPSATETPSPAPPLAGDPGPPQPPTTPSAPGVPAADPNYTRSACGSVCTTNTVSSCRATVRQGKDTSSVNMSVYQCQNGQFLGTYNGGAVQKCYTAGNPC